MENQRETLIDTQHGSTTLLRRKVIFKRGSVGFTLGLILSTIILNSTYGILQLIGFGSHGVISGSWAANYEAKYNGTIPKDSWFAGKVKKIIWMKAGQYCLFKILKSTFFLGFSPL